MLYLLDANVLIDANRDYYPLDRVPEFWEWLQRCAAEGHVKVAREIHKEVADGNDALAAWIKQPEVRSDLLLDEDADVGLMRRVVNTGYAADLSDLELGKLGRDPFLIAYALAHPDQRCVITTEVSKPKRQRANRHIPDVCKTLNVQCENTFFLIRTLDFRTK